jgi:hypothetical protein
MNGDENKRKDVMEAIELSTGISLSKHEDDDNNEEGNMDDQSLSM